VLAVVGLLERTADLAEVLPNARIVTLPGQGHVAHLMAPHLLSAQIRAAAESTSNLNDPAFDSRPDPV
jgi:pimeloyl-ACP methyl ester carboxylesterase